MRKTIAKIGNSQGIIFDTALMELAYLQTGDEVNVEARFQPQAKDGSNRVLLRPANDQAGDDVGDTHLGYLDLCLASRRRLSTSRHSAVPGGACFK